MLGTIAFQQGDLRKAALHFRVIHSREPRLKDWGGYSPELFRLLACRLEEMNPQAWFAGLDWPGTSNGLFPTLLGPTDPLDLGDFSTLGEYQRFKGRPPISEHEIQVVDTDKLLRALLRLKR